MARPGRRAASLAVVLVAAQIALPPLTGRVVDEADLLTAAEEAALAERLAAIEAETSVQIVVVTVPSLDGEPIEDFAIRLAEAWKIGQRGLDNGVIVVVARDERRVRIEVGYGLEPVIPDGLAGRIIREAIAPRFRQGDYYGGLAAAVEAIDRAARREFPAGDEWAPPASRGVPFELGLFLFVLVGVLGNVVGTLVAALLGGLLASGLALAAGADGWTALVAFPFGFLLGAFLALVFRGRRGRVWTSGGLHGHWGGGFGGGGFGGGGFGGGGGRFGGGGASGSW